MSVQERKSIVRCNNNGEISMSLLDELNGYYFDELSEGMSAVFGKTVT